MPGGNRFQDTHSCLLKQLLQACPHLQVTQLSLTWDIIQTKELFELVETRLFPELSQMEIVLYRGCGGVPVDELKAVLQKLSCRRLEKLALAVFAFGALTNGYRDDEYSDGDPIGQEGEQVDRFQEETESGAARGGGSALRHLKSLNVDNLECRDTMERFWPWIWKQCGQSLQELEFTNILRVSVTLALQMKRFLPNLDRIIFGNDSGNARFITDHQIQKMLWSKRETGWKAVKLGYYACWAIGQ